MFFLIFRILVVILAAIGFFSLVVFLWRRIKRDGKTLKPIINVGDIRDKTKFALEKINIDPNILTVKVLEATKKEASKRVKKFLIKNPKLSFFGEIASSILTTPAKTSPANQLSRENQDIINALVKQFKFNKQDCLEALKELPNDIEITIEEKIKKIVINLAQR